MFTTATENSKNGKLIFIISFVVFAFYFIGYIVAGDVYRYAVVGAIYKLLWLPMLASLLIVPVISVAVFFKKERHSKLYAALSILLIASSILIMTTQ